MTEDVISDRLKVQRGSLITWNHNSSGRLWVIFNSCQNDFMKEKWKNNTKRSMENQSYIKKNVRTTRIKNTQNENEDSKLYIRKVSSFQ